MALGGKTFAEAPARFGIAKDAEFFGALDLQRPALAAVKAAADAKDWAAARSAWAAYLTGRTAPCWTWTHFDRVPIKRVLDAQYGGLSGSIPAADKVLAREFALMGKPRTVEHDPSWRYGANELTDNLSRFYYFEDLGKAYWATGEAKYAADFALLLNSWIAKNPVTEEIKTSWKEPGTVWWTLQVGIRVPSWLDVMQYFMDAPEFDADAKYQLTRSFVEHARRLYAHQSEFHQGNWQVQECTSLASLGIMFPEFKEAAGWRDRGFQYLVEHMHKDVYPDGGQYELTPGYHAAVMMNYVHILYLCRLNGYTVPGLFDRHEKMFDWLMQISKPDRVYPNVGDVKGHGSAAGSLGIGALLYNRPDMRFLGVDKVPVDWIWQFGPEVIERYAKLPSKPAAPSSYLLPISKFAMMRTGWQPEDKYLLFKCAPWGGGHCHQDRLEVVAYAGRELLIDPGVCSYDLDLSASYFRRSEAHSVLMVDGRQQPQSDPKVLAWHTSKDADFAAGEIEADGLRHRRSVLFLRPDYWVVVDHVYDTGTHEVTRQFHFPIGPVVVEGPVMRSAFADGKNLAVHDVSGARLEQREGLFPTTPIQIDRTPVAAFVSTVTLPAVFCAVLLPFHDAKALPTVENIGGAGDLLTRLRVAFPSGQTDEIVIAPDATGLTLGATHATARAICVRTGPEAHSVSVIPVPPFQAR